MPCCLCIVSSCVGDVIDPTRGPGPSWAELGFCSQQSGAFLFLASSTKGNRAELCSCRHGAVVGCRKLITGFIKTWIDSFRPPCSSCLGRVYRRCMALEEREGERERGKERERERAFALRQMPYSSHRGYFVVSKWPFGLCRPRMLMWTRSWYPIKGSHSGSNWAPKINMVLSLVPLKSDSTQTFWPVITKQHW